MQSLSTQSIAILFVLGIWASSSVAQPSNQWQSPTTADRPSLALYGKKPLIVLMCEHGRMKLHARDFAVVQQWPQPELTFLVGDVRRTKRPDLRMIGEDTGFEIEFPVADSVLNAIDSGQTLKAEYNGQTKQYPLPPATLRKAFSKNCAAQLPAALRAE